MRRPGMTDQHRSKSSFRSELNAECSDETLRVFTLEVLVLDLRQTEPLINERA